jgi:hypothetical protein
MPLNNKALKLLFCLIIFYLINAAPIVEAQTRIEDNTIPNDVDNRQLIGIGFYSLFSPPMKYQQFARITKDAGCNAVRAWVYNSYGKYFPWKKNAQGLYDLKQLEKGYFKMMRRRIAYLDRVGLKVILVVFDESGMRDFPGAWENHAWNSQNNIHGFIRASRQGVPDFYRPEYWPIQRRYIDALWEIVGKNYKNALFFEVTNEGSAGWQWEERVIAYLRAKGALHIVSSSAADTERIIPLVDIYSFHGISLAEQVQDTYQGKKYMWSSDGIMRGSSDIIQFKGKPHYGYYPTAEEVYELAAKVLQIGGHLEFNLSGRLEENKGIYDDFLLNLMRSISRAVKETHAGFKKQKQ